MKRALAVWGTMLLLVAAFASSVGGLIALANGTGSGLLPIQAAIVWTGAVALVPTLTVVLVYLSRGDARLRAELLAIGLGVVTLSTVLFVEEVWRPWNLSPQGVLCLMIGAGLLPSLVYLALFYPRRAAGPK